MVTNPTTLLNNGIEMPLLGLGVYDMYHQEAERAVSQALEIGYRLIDTAAMYGNEAEVGRAIRASGLPRHDVFVTTKVHDADQGYDNTLRAFEVSRQKLNVDYIDLYLIHWPIKASRKATWQALERLATEKQVRAIGVANYLGPFLHQLAEYATLVPAVNQVEFSPYLFLADLLAQCQQQHTVLQAYSPLVRGQRFSDPKLLALAQRYDKTPAQIIIRWAIQLGVSTIPKTVQLARLKENFAVWDFHLSDSDMRQLAGFNEDFRVVDDPMTLF